MSTQDEYALISLTLNPENGFEVLKREVLSLPDLSWSAYNLPNYDITSDGNRVLVSKQQTGNNSGESGLRPVIVNPVLVENITAELNRLAPVDPN